MNRHREIELGRQQDTLVGSQLRRDNRYHTSDQDSQQVTSHLSSHIQDGRQQRSEAGGNYSAHGREKDTSPSTYIGRIGRENHLQGSLHSASQEESTDKVRIFTEINKKGKISNFMPDFFFFHNKKTQFEIKLKMQKNI